MVLTTVSSPKTYSAGFAALGSDHLLVVFGSGNLFGLALVRMHTDPVISMWSDLNTHSSL